MRDLRNIERPPQTADDADVISCFGCGAALYHEDRYCACCGIPTRRLCRECGAPIMQLIANYCSSCGTHLD